MVIKDAKKYDSEGPVWKKNKTKKSTRNPLIVIIDDDDDDDPQFGLPITVEGGKKKHVVEGNSSNPKKKKKKKLDSKLKNGAFADLPDTTQSSSDLESVKEAEKPPKALKKKRERGHHCKRESSPEIPSQGQTTDCVETSFLVKKCKTSILEPCAGSSGYSSKRKKKQPTLACSLIQSQAEDDYSKKDLPPTMKMISHQTMLSDRKPALVQGAVSKGESKDICCFASADGPETRNGVWEKGSANPTHELQEQNNCKQDHKDTAHISKKKRQRTEQEGKKKWKKKKKKKLKEEVDFLLEWAGKQEDHPAVSTETPQSEEKRKKTDLIQNSEGKIKGHKRKKSHTKVANNSPGLVEENKDAFAWEGKAAAIERAKKKAKKAKKKAKKERDAAVRLESSRFLENSSQQCCATKRKAKKTEGAEEEPRPKQAKIKKGEKV